ncbi:hypothetical protein [Arthrobacter sp. UYCo732]|uniref:hypothetical protein n=1 Tax=Arthrobacter sp. UYCo732 TaxID=3156336 RepID=UPI00339B2498
MSAGTEPVEPLGSGAFVNEDGLAVVIELTPMDRLVIACLQDVEDHPDLIVDEAA